jgi:hypothetical protein
MIYSNETVKSFINRCMLRMDQELDPESNLWSQNEMVEYMNEGCREVWQAVREEHQNWFVRTMTSTDSIKKIGGRDFNPAALRLVPGRARLLLPPDFRELLFLEGLPPTSAQEIPDQFSPVVTFEYRNLTQKAFRQEVLNTFPTNTRSYLYDVVFAMDGPFILLSPPLALSESLDAQIQYLAAPLTLRLADTFEGTGFTLEMTDAILQYVIYQAVVKEKSEDLPAFERAWNLKRELAVRSAGLKQTRDEEVVETSVCYEDEF